MKVVVNEEDIIIQAIENLIAKTNDLNAVGPFLIATLASTAACCGDPHEYIDVVTQSAHDAVDAAKEIGLIK